LPRALACRDPFWSVRVSGNWRVIFRFDEAHAFDVDLVDYHCEEQEP
jgi:plasmid maintenance system killer protein